MLATSIKAQSQGRKLIGVRLPLGLVARLQQEANRQRLRQQDLVEDALEAHLQHLERAGTSDRPATPKR